MLTRVSLIVEALLTFIAVFSALELHRKLATARKTKSVRDSEGIIKKITDKLVAVADDQKAEYLPPMNDVEYEQHLLDENGRGGLLRAVLNKVPWTSKGRNSRSSDS